ncbi:hypothetical protein LTR95_016806 [Oleoguttula sp. CCFEE 5521]
MADLSLHERVPSPEVPDSQMEDIDSMVATPALPAEDDETYNSDASDDVRPSNSRAVSVESESSGYDDLAMAEELQDAEKRREYELRDSTKTGKHPSASSWIDQDPTDNYDPKVEARKLRKLNRPKKRKVVTKPTQDESEDDEMQDVAPELEYLSERAASKVPQGGPVPTSACKTLEEIGAMRRTVENGSEEDAETRQKAARGQEKNLGTGTGLGNSILGPVQPKQSRNSSQHQQYAPVLQNLRTHDGRPGGCPMCDPKFVLHGQRTGQKQGTIIPICFECQMSRLPTTQCGHEKIRGIASIQTKMLDVSAAYSRLDGPATDDPDIWCSLCFNLAVHRCRDVKGTEVGCGLALCTECSHAMRKEYNGNLQDLLAAMKRGGAGRRKRGWRTDALLLEAQGPLVRLIESEDQYHMEN